MNVSVVEPTAPAGDERVGGHRPLPSMAFASADVVCEHFAGRGMQRHQTSLAELGAADGQQRCRCAVSPKELYSPSRTTPTISINGASGLLVRNRFPIASSPGQKPRAKVSF